MTEIIQERSQKLKILDLFSGIGGFSLGLERTDGFQTGVCGLLSCKRNHSILGGNPATYPGHYRNGH
jgi:hypothetical protein